MIIKKVICDKCGKEIDRPHPVKCNIFGWEKDLIKPNRGTGSYKVIRGIHLCEKCENELYNWLDGSEAENECN